MNVHGLELDDEDLYSARCAARAARRAASSSRSPNERAWILRSDRRASRCCGKLGYRIAVDDLGAGYAALGALATLEPEIVKLDMSLIRDLDRHTNKRRIVRAITGICSELGSRVVAEGIETEGERHACIDAGIDLLQGFLFAHPTKGFASVSL